MKGLFCLWICLVAGFFALFTLTGCTLSFQNISTHGSATDVVDENLDTSPKVSATISAVPKF